MNTETPGTLRSSLSIGSKKSFPPLINHKNDLKKLCEHVAKSKPRIPNRIQITPEMYDLAFFWQIDNKYPSLLFYRHYHSDFVMRVR